MVDIDKVVSSTDWLDFDEPCLVYADNCYTFCTLPVFHEITYMTVADTYVHVLLYKCRCHSDIVILSWDCRMYVCIMFSIYSAIFT